MILWGLLAGCWIDWTNLDGVDGPTTCEGDVAPVAWYRDEDGDGYGSDAEVVTACDPPDGYAPAGGDCDEGDPHINPATPEACNGIDDDCDFQVDEGGATWCNDNDNDGHGSPDDVIHACEKPAGFVDSCDDCDDSNPDIHAGAEEVPNDGVDNDCDDLVDEP